VGDASDLPPYLVLGDLDPESFELSANGWSARWQGTEEDTYLDVTYKAADRRWEVRQIWCGLDGGYSTYPSRIPLERVIGQTLYLRFPQLWDNEAKARIEAGYQISVLKEPESMLGFFGNPDGAFRTIIFPVAVRNLRVMRQWIKDIAEESPLKYPVSVEARLLFQAVNFVDGKAPDWSRQPILTFKQSLIETGLAPLGLPVREEADDGTAAWTLRRDNYFLFISLPFAGLTDFLRRLASDYGPIRTATDPDLRFWFRPVVLPATFEMQAQEVAFWDQDETIRSYLGFTPLNKELPEKFINPDHELAAVLDRIEEISSIVRRGLERILQQ